MCWTNNAFRICFDDRIGRFRVDRGHLLPHSFLCKRVPWSLMDRMGKFTVDRDLVLPHRCNVRGFHWSPIMDQFGELTKLMNYLQNVYLSI